MRRFEIDELDDGDGGDLIASNRGAAVRDLESRGRRRLEENFDASIPFCRTRRDVGTKLLGDYELKLIEPTLVPRVVEIVEVELEGEVDRTGWDRSPVDRRETGAAGFRAHRSRGYVAGTIAAEGEPERERQENAKARSKRLLGQGRACSLLLNHLMKLEGQSETASTSSGGHDDPTVGLDLGPREGSMLQDG
jgi:hypothetical protein